jgi:hypothetical protein
LEVQRCHYDSQLTLGGQGGQGERSGSLETEGGADNYN